MNRFIASLVAIFCISGCAGFRQSRLPDVNPDELKSGAAMSGGAMTGAATAGKTAAKAAVGKRLLFLSTGWQFERNGTQIAKENYSQYQSYAESQRTIPGIFRESRSWQVVRDSAVADIDVDLQIHFKQNTKFGNMFVTIATLLVFPYVGSSEHEVHILATNRAGATILDETLEDGVNEWLEILLLPVAPFSSPHHAEERSFENTLRTAASHLERALTQQSGADGNPEP